MPPYYAPSHRRKDHAEAAEAQSEDDPAVLQVSPEELARLGELHRQTTQKSHSGLLEKNETHAEFHDFLKENNPGGKWYPEHRGVCFDSLSVLASSNPGYSAKTLGTALWRTLTFQDILEQILPSSLKLRGAQPNAIISDFTGVVRSGEMMLVLGNPGSGCSTFLRTVGNDHSAFESIQGFLSFSGLSADKIRRNHRGEVSYVPEDDVHFPTLTVRQTLDFALRSKTPKRHHGDIPGFLEVYAKSFGMSHVMDTIVGNEWIRGISGGEKKRLSIMESLAVDSAVVAWDNSTRGLDAASAVKYAQSLRILTDVTAKATIVTIYQASDEVLELMDKVMLIDEGRILFQGPADEAKPYFERLGYLCDGRQRISDFLTSITSPTQRRFREGCEKAAPKGAVELERAFKDSTFYAQVLQDVQKYRADEDSEDTQSEENATSPFEDSRTVKKSRYEPTSSSYNTSIGNQLRICLLREWWQLRQHMSPLYVRLMSIIVNAFLIGSMFYNQPRNTDGMYSRGGFVFYSVITTGWIQLAELEGAMEGRLIVARHKTQAMVRPSLVGLAKVVFDLAIVLVGVVIFAVVVYFLAGMRREAGPFFFFVLVLYLETVCFTQLYRVFAAASPSFELALRYCGVLLLACILFGGYLYPLGRLFEDVPWVAWLAYLTPVIYGFEAIVITEFQGLVFDCVDSAVVPRGPEYQDDSLQTCAYAGAQPGQTFIDGDDYYTSYFAFDRSHLWRNVGIIIAMTVAYVALSLFLLEVSEWNSAGASGIQFSKKQQSLANKTDEEATTVSAASQPYDDTEHQQAEATTVKATNSVFTWNNISYDVSVAGTERRFLDGVSGYCKPREMTALVGASGAGKSTLLTALSQRQKTGSVHGELRADGQELSLDFRRQIGFCSQADIHDDSSTIREAFLFSARLRQDQSVPDSEKVMYADSVLGLLGLREFSEALIGSLGLEMKRKTSIGVELCAKPTLLMFLDEPTSGLDSKGALSIVRLLRKLADGGQAILCTIHQASHQQIELFDRILALQRGGKVFYNGPVGTSGDAVFDYFQERGCRADRGTNMADFIIEVGTGSTIPQQGREVDWSKEWANSAEAQDVLRVIERVATTSTGASSPSDNDVQQYSSSTVQQVQLLTVRNLRQFWRLPEYQYARLYACLVHALLNGLTYLQLGNSEHDLQSMAYSLFLILMLVPEFINGISMRFIANRNIWLEKEYPSRTYGNVAFASSQILAELPFTFIGAIIFFVVFYFMVGLPLGVQAGYSFLMTLFFHLFSVSWGQWIAALSPDAMVAANLMPFFIIVCELFNGILRPPHQMPVFWQYTMYYITPFTYWIGGTMAMVLTGRPVICNPDELVYFELPPTASTCGTFAEPFLQSASGYISNPSESRAGQLCGYCQYSSGEDFLGNYGLSSSTVWRDFAIFIGFLVSNYLLVYVFVWWGTPRSGQRKGKAN
ncbi:hypothetical protein MBLNU230_g3282t1 [Neophaeotheca triangularis]